MNTKFEIQRYYKFFMIFLFFFTAGCDKDKTIDEYQRDKLRKNLALYRSVAGEYTGVVYSKIDNSVLGAMQLTLTADTSVSSPSGSEITAGAPILVGNIRFLDENITLLSAPNGFFDPSTGVYSAQITITRAPHESNSRGGGTKEIISINGVIRSGSIAGSIAALQFPESGGQFKLRKNGHTIEEILFDVRGHTDNRDDQPAQKQVSAFSGETQFKSGIKKQTRVIILQPIRGTSEDFLNLISPVKIVQVSFNYSQSLHLHFSDAILDTRQGLLTGQYSAALDSDAFNMNLNCQLLANRELNCKHLTTNQGVVAQTRAELDLTQMPQLPDTEEGTESITKSFIGRGRMTPGAHDQNMKLVVTEPSRGQFKELLELFFPNSEKNVIVAVNFTENVSVAFTDVKWDSINGGLDGHFSSSGEFTAYIKCENFYFMSSNKPFVCRYWTTRSGVIVITFKPPFKD